MPIIDDQGFYKISRISGPQHNYLALALAPHAVADVAIIAQNIDHAPPQLSEKAVLQQILAALTQHNAEAKNPLHLAAIEYVASDTPPVEIYFDLTLAILRHAADNPQTAHTKPQNGTPPA